ncbi:MAG: hypothetical protein B7X53_18515 [Hyphomonas sp. 34-62-18]|nr:YceI family protein [Hyphomonas sp. 34-62-18]OZB11940.1 MAG: hypothetical protein B7X53_18515 [Hyphomonas sp. 34-62-18]
MDRGNQSQLGHSLFRAGAALALAAIFLAGCSSVAGALLAPKVDATASRLSPGDFALDTDRFEASLSGDAANPAGASVEAIIDMASLNIANPEFAGELMGPAWFDAASHPQAVFRSTSIQLTSETTAEITGDLTLKGVTRPITLAAKLNGSAYDPLRQADVVGFSASGEISRADFGIDRFSGLLTDTVRIEIEAEFIRQKPD